MKFEYKDLLEQKLISVKEYPDGKKILKYSKRVFWDNLWHVDERLLECRGLVLDRDNNIIVRPFKKVFNYGENGTSVPLETIVQAIPKINGFLGCITKTDNGELIYSTTGSLDSDYVAMIKEMLPHDIVYKWLESGYTHMFEICHPSDPHIIDEEYGAYIIGQREVDTGHLSSEEWLSMCYDFKCAPWKYKEYGILPFKDLLEKVKNCKHEGYMVRSAGLGRVDSGLVLCKIKSPYYLTKKFIMRMSKTKVDDMFDNPEKFKQQMDEEFYSLMEYIVNTFDKDVWKGYDDQHRRTIIEEFFNGFV